MKKIKCHKCGFERKYNPDSENKTIKCSKCHTILGFNKSENDGKEDTSSGHKKFWRNYYRIALLVLIITGIFFSGTKGVQIYRRVTFNPHPHNAFVQSRKYIKAYGDLADKNKIKFSDSYEFITLSKWDSLYRIRSKLLTKIFFMDKYIELPYEVDMEYLGEGNWRYVDLRYFTEDLQGDYFEF